MRNSKRVVSRVIAIGAVFVFLAPAVAMGQTAPADWTVSRTPDGHPDLQGVWANNSATPMQRPEAWAGKDRLNDEELAELVAAAAEASDPGQDALFGDQLVLAAIQRTQAKSYDPTTGNYNGFWIADRPITSRTSLVIDPPDGRIPSMTSEAQARTTEQFANASGGRSTRMQVGRCRSAVSATACRTSRLDTTATTTLPKRRTTSGLSRR